MSPSSSPGRFSLFVLGLIVAVCTMVLLQSNLVREMAITTGQSSKTVLCSFTGDNNSNGQLESPLPENFYQGYRPAFTEAYLLEHAGAMGLGSKEYVDTSAGCPIWTMESVTNPTVYADLMQFRTNLAMYTARVHNFRTNITDLRMHIAANGNYDICQAVDLHPDGVQSFFGGNSSHPQLSFTRSGFVEPLLTPMRHPEFCFDGSSLMDLNYLVHDFGTMCRKLKPTSRIVLLDMGASLSFHGDTASPAMYLTDIYHRFGFPFDHIYAWEVTATPPGQVFDAVPRHLMPAYHWINVGVNATPGSHLNPFTTVAAKYNDDDLIVVKLDIDTPTLELPLAMQLLHDEGLLQLVDQFYFEHHVPLWELRGAWGSGVSGSIQESLELFQKLREQGVAAHFWV